MAPGAGQGREWSQLWGAERAAWASMLDGALGIARRGELGVLRADTKLVAK